LLQTLPLVRVAQPIWDLRLLEHPAQRLQRAHQLTGLEFLLQQLLVAPHQGLARAAQAVAALLVRQLQQLVVPR
jgi:hypothetical protein